MAEVAGLVLGALSLLLAGIQGYSVAMETFKGARKYSSILSQYNNDLMVEEAVLQNTWSAVVRLGQHAIVQRFPGLSLEELRKNPHQAMDAHNIPLQTILSLALPDCKEPYLEVIEGLYKHVAALAETFDVTIGSQEGRPQMNQTADKGKLKNLRVMLETELKAKSRNENLEEIRRQNLRLSDLVGRQLTMQIHTAVHSSSLNHPTTVQTATNLYNIIQYQAKALHSVLQQGFQSSVYNCCRIGHGGFLQLKVRGIPAAPPIPAPAIHNRDGPMGGVNTGCRFGLTLCVSLEGFTIQQEEGYSACELELEIVDEHEDRRETHISTPSSLTPDGSTGVETRDITGVQACGSPDISRTSERNAEPPLVTHGSASWRSKGRSLKSKFTDFSSSSSDSIARTFGGLRRSISADARQTSGLACSPGRMRDTAQVSLKVKGEATDKNGHIPQIVFSGPDNLQMYALQPHPTGAASKRTPWLCQICAIPNDEAIDLLCLAAAAAAAGQEEEQRGCVGILAKTGKDKVRVCPRGGKPLKVEPVEVVTLDRLFSQHKIPSVLERLQLAVLLASSVMQLHETSWLNELWCSRDIFFKWTDGGSVQFDEPYLKSTFHGAQASTDAVAPKEDDWEDCMVYCNRTLFKLGIMLIEIHYWQPFKALVQGRRRSEAVRAIIPELSRNAGKRYGCAVGLCVGGLGCEAIDLGHEGFKNAAYEKIVAPLEEDLKFFRG